MTAYPLLQPDGQIDAAAVAERAQALTGTSYQREVSVDLGLDDRWSVRSVHTITISAEEAEAFALAEADSQRCTRQFEQNQARQLAAEEADAQALAANYKFDVPSLQFERDRYFFGNSTSRSIQLPRYERALKIARDRKAKRDARHAPRLEAAE
jgi:hypothetical protein